MFWPVGKPNVEAPKFQHFNIILESLRTTMIADLGSEVEIMSFIIAHTR